MSGTYAKQTQVTEQKSRDEIERTLARYGADQFLYAREEGRAVIRFRMNLRQISFVLPLPVKEDFPLPTGYMTSPALKAAEARRTERFEQAVRQRWRALALIVKAKLEAVEAGVTSFDDEFLAHMLLADGSTFGDWAAPQIEQIYRMGTMPPLLTAGGQAIQVGEN